MPTLVERLTAAKQRAERAQLRQRELDVLLDKRVTHLKCILGTGAINGKLVDECLKHVGEKQRAIALAILQVQAERLRIDTPPDAPA